MSGKQCLMETRLVGCSIGNGSEAGGEDGGPAPRSARSMSHKENKAALLVDELGVVSAQKPSIKIAPCVAKLIPQHSLDALCGVCPSDNSLRFILPASGNAVAGGQLDFIPSLDVPAFFYRAGVRPFRTTSLGVDVFRFYFHACQLPGYTSGRLKLLTRRWPSGVAKVRATASASSGDPTPRFRMSCLLSSKVFHQSRTCNQY